jgi:D-glycero-D-manno-heptose 1,7-bisphosphate phosphatase
MCDSTVALVLDRDGTLIEHIPYLSDPSLVALLPGVQAGLQLAVAAGARLFLHTNQSGVGRGLFQMADVESCNRRMIELLGFGPNVFERICVAPESPESPSPYRKPSPQFALEIMSEFSLKPCEIFYIGDRATDLQTALAAQTKAIGVSTGLIDLEAELNDSGLSGKYKVCSSFDIAIDLVLSGLC